MSAKTPYWIARTARVCPNAARLGRIACEGSYALLSCRDGESRHVRLFMSAGDRNRAVAAWDRIGHCGLGEKCRFDHPTMKIDETENETPEITTEKTANHAA
jgi:hypothetical protein